MLIEDSICSGDSSPEHESSESFTKSIKILNIHKAIRSKNVTDLRSLAISSQGLIRDTLRRTAWPILLDLDLSVPLKAPKPDELIAHRYFNQVALDVERTIQRFPPTFPRRLRLSIQAKTLTLIMRVLVTHPDLHYYQGYHDICVTVLLVLNGDQDLAFRVMNKLSTTKLTPFMSHTIEETSEQLNTIYPIIGSVSNQLETFLKESNCGINFFLSWCITWFAHDLRHYSTLVRLFDLFIASDDLMPVYVTASMVLRRERLILRQECSLAGIHGFFRHVLKSVDNFGDELEDVIKNAVSLHNRLSLGSLSDGTEAEILTSRCGSQGKNCQIERPDISERA